MIILNWKNIRMIQPTFDDIDIEDEAEDDVPLISGIKCLPNLAELRKYSINSKIEFAQLIN